MSAPCNASRDASRIPVRFLLTAWFVLLSASSVRGQPRHRVGIDVDNDILAEIVTDRPTDYEYTHGTRLWAESGQLAFLPWLLDDPLGCRSSDACRHRFMLSQELYTPRRDWPEPIEGQRPHAAWLYIAVETLRATDHKTTRIGALIGIVGPYAYGEDVQRAVHKWLGFRQPQGWEHQLPLEPTIQFRISQERRLISAAKGLAAYGLILDSGVDLGNALIMGSGQIVAQLCLSRRPCASPLPHNASAPSLVLRAAIGTRAILRNVFLDGTMRQSHSVKKRHLVPTATGSIAVRFHGIEIVYSLLWRAREYLSEPAGFTYGSLSFGYAW